MTDDDTHTDKTVESRKIWVRRMTLILYVIGLQLKHLLRHMPFWKIFYRMKRESCSFFMLRLILVNFDLLRKTFSFLYFERAKSNGKEQGSK